MSPLTNTCKNERGTEGMRNYSNQVPLSLMTKRKLPTSLLTLPLQSHQMQGRWLLQGKRTYNLELLRAWSSLEKLTAKQRGSSGCTIKSWRELLKIIDTILQSCKFAEAIHFCSQLHYPHYFVSGFRILGGLKYHLIIIVKVSECRQLTFAFISSSFHCMTRGLCLI